MDVPVEDPLAEVARTFLAALRQVGTARTFHAGQQLIKAGAPSTEVLLIESGSVKVILHGDEGHEILANIFAAGELVGELGVLSRRPRSATVIARVQGVARHISTAVFLALVSGDPARWLFVSSIMQERITEADRRQIAYASWDVTTRVADQLLIWTRAMGTEDGEHLILTGISRKELAQAVVASEKTVDAALRTWTDRGLLVTGHKKFVLTDPAELERRVSAPLTTPSVRIPEIR
jgi:CRP/FNR family transcriptional regulator, cyclic AMP receptor protein